MHDEAGPAWDWNVAVFCRNEEDTIVGCLAAIERAVAGRRVLVCLIINGSSDASEARAIAFAATCSYAFMLARIETGDKTNAINAFNYHLRVPARTYIYVDGYVTFAEASFALLAAALERNPHPVAATGVSGNGRTMKLATEATLAVGGHLHGGLHAFRPAFIERMVRMGIRMPTLLYSGDGLMGSIAAHNLDAMGTEWDNTRILGVPEARFYIRTLSPFRLGDIKRQCRRMVRQARGRLQNAAIKDIIYRKGYEGLPDNADDMVRDYVARCGVPVLPMRMRPFVILALWGIRRAKRPPQASLEARVTYANRPGLLEGVRGAG